MEVGLSVRFRVAARFPEGSMETLELTGHSGAPGLIIATVSNAVQTRRQGFEARVAGAFGSYQEA